MNNSVPSAGQIRAALGLLNMENGELASAAGVSVETIINAKSGQSNQQQRIRDRIRRALEARGVEFIGNGLRLSDDMVRVLDGDDAYMQMLNDVLSVTAPNGGEVLFLFSDDRVARPGEMEMETKIRSNGVRFRVLIEEGNNITRWPREEYRQIPNEYFNHDLQVIYGDKVAQVIAGGQKIMIISNPSFATSVRNLFNMLWPAMRKVAGDNS